MKSQIIHGNCYDVLPTLPRGEFQAIFIDPPYNFSFDYGSGPKADSLPTAEYLARMETLAHECVALLTDTGSIWFLVPERWADEIGTILKRILPRRNRIIWRETFGQYRETSFPSGHRHLFWHVKDSKRSPFYTDAIRIPSQRMLNGDKRAKGPRVPDDVWKIPRLVGNARERMTGHPCQLPEALLERIICCSSDLNDLILDPMAGTGTTLRVAHRLRRRYLGIEEQTKFVELIKKRLSRVLQQDLF